MECQTVNGIGGDDAKEVRPSVPEEVDFIAAVVLVGTRRPRVRAVDILGSTRASVATSPGV